MNGQTTYVPITDVGPQMRFQQEGNGQYDIVCPPLTTIHYLLVGPGAPSAAGGGGGGGGAVVTGTFRLDEETPLRLDVTSSQSNLFMPDADGQYVGVGDIPAAVRGEEASADPDTDGVGNAGNSADISGVFVQLWGIRSSEMEYGRGGVGLNTGTQLINQSSFGRGGNAFSGGVDLGRPGAIYIWFEQELLTHLSFTRVSAVRQEGSIGGYFTDVPQFGLQVPEHGLTFTGAPADSTRVETYTSAVPCIHPTNIGFYADIGNLTGPVISTPNVNGNACVHQCLSPPGYVILLVRFRFGTSLQITSQGVWSSVVTPFANTVISGTQTIVSKQTFTNTPPLRLVFRSSVEQDTVLDATLNANLVLSSVLSDTIGETSHYAGGNLFVTGQRGDSVLVFHRDDLRDAQNALLLDVVETGVPCTAHIARTLGVAPSELPTGTVTRVPIDALYPLRCASFAVLVTATGSMNDGVGMTFTDVYPPTRNEMAFVENSDVFPDGTTVYAQPGAPGVTVEIPRTAGQVDVLSTAFSVTPPYLSRGAVSESLPGNLSFSNIPSILVSQNGILGEDPRGLVYTGDYVDISSKPTILNAWSQLAAGDTNVPVPTVRPDLVWRGLVEPDATFPLRVYDTGVFESLYVLIVDNDTFVYNAANVNMWYVPQSSGGTLNGVALVENVEARLPAGLSHFVGTVDVSYRSERQDIVPFRRAVPSAGLSSDFSSDVGLFTTADAVTPGSFPALQPNANGNGAPFLNNVPPGVFFCRVGDVLTELQTATMYTTAQSPLSVGASAVLQTIRYTSTEGNFFVVAGDAAPIRVNPFAVVDGFAYGLLMKYTDAIPPPPSGGGGGGDIGGGSGGASTGSYPTIGRYVPRSTDRLNILGINVYPRTSNKQILDSTGKTYRIPIRAYVCLSWMVRNPTLVTEHDLAFAWFEGCPPLLLTALLFLPGGRVSTGAFAQASARYSIRIPTSLQSARR